MLDFLGAGSRDAESSFGDAQARHMIATKIREFGDQLTGKESEIFHDRMIAEEPMTLRELGERYEVSRERVRQLEDRIRKRLRSFLVEAIPDIADVEVRQSITEGS